MTVHVSIVEEETVNPFIFEFFRRVEAAHETRSAPQTSTATSKVKRSLIVRYVDFRPPYW